MLWSRFLDCLAADYDRLRAVIVLDEGAAVPTCPGWTVADLIRHVGEVYLHKTQAMRDGVEPADWPPPRIAGESPRDLLEQAYADLRGELDASSPADPAGTWYGPDQTVGFWIRRMAHETVIHRIDAELATGQPVAPIPDDLAIDGIDELLRVFLAYSVAEWGDDFSDILDDSPGETVSLRADGAAWAVWIGPGRLVVTDAVATEPDATVSGSPQHMLRWVWNRDAEPSGVTVDGRPDAVARLRRCIVTATQ